MGRLAWLEIEGKGCWESPQCPRQEDRLSFVWRFVAHAAFWEAGTSRTGPLQPPGPRGLSTPVPPTPGGLALVVGERGNMQDYPERGW